MPQMSPIQWDYLYLLMVVFIFMVLVNFFFSKLNKVSNFFFKNKINSFNINWLW